jgi:hypothetical protein
MTGVQLEVRSQQSQARVPTKRIANLDDYIPETQPTVLSLQELSLLKTLLDIIVVWGITPCMEEGVGVSLSKRSRFPNISVEESSDVKITQNNVRKDRLMACIRLLLLLAEEKTELLPVVASKYLVDLLASLLQLKSITAESNAPAYSQISSPASLVTIVTEHSSPEYQYCQDSMNYIIDRYLTSKTYN